MKEYCYMHPTFRCDSYKGCSDSTLEVECVGASDLVHIKSSVVVNETIDEMQGGDPFIRF